MHFVYSLGGFDLKHVFNVKDLGVIFSSDFSLNENLRFVTLRAAKLLGFIC